MSTRIRTCVVLLVFWPFLAYSQEKPKVVRSQLLTVDGKPQHIKGANLAWLNGAYGHDFGPLPLHPDWKIEFNEEDLGRYFADMKRMDLNVVRIFVFEDLEGLVFDRDGYVKEIDKLFLTNFDKAINLADKNGLHLYLSLSNNFWKVCREGGYKNIIVHAEARKRYIENAVKPFASRYKGNSSIFAFEIMSEPEHVIAGKHGNRTDDGCTWDQMRVFLRENAGAIHSVDSKRLVSAGSGWHYLENIKSGLYSKLGFDFYDVHTRLGVDAPLPDVRTLKLDKPIIIGEFNIDGNDKSMTDERQKQLFAKLLAEVKNGGYAGALVWCYDFPNQKDTNSKAMNLLTNDGTLSWKPACYIIRDFKWR